MVPYEGVFGTLLITNALLYLQLQGPVEYLHTLRLGAANIRKKRKPPPKGDGFSNLERLLIK